MNNPPPWDVPPSGQDHFAEMSASSSSNLPSPPDANDQPPPPPLPPLVPSTLPPPYTNVPTISLNTSQAATPTEIEQPPPRPRGGSRTGKRVGFTASSGFDEPPQLDDRLNPRSAATTGARFQPPSEPASGYATPRDANGEYLSPVTSRDDRTPAEAELVKAVHKAFGQPLPSKPKPAIRKKPSVSSNPFASIEDSEDDDTPARRARNDAHDRANRLARSVGSASASAPGSRRGSNESAESIPMEPMSRSRRRQAYMEDLISGDEDDDDIISKPLGEGTLTEAKRIVSIHTKRDQGHRVPLHTEPTPLISRPTTPTMDQRLDDYVPQPTKYRGGIFGALLNLYSTQGGMSAAMGGGSNSHSGHHRLGSNATTLSANTSGTPTPGGVTPAMTPQPSPPQSGTTTPVGRRQRPWYAGGHSNNPSNSSLAQLVGSSSVLGSAAATPGEMNEGLKRSVSSASRPGMGKRTRSGGSIKGAMHRLGRPRLEDEIRITVHISEVMARQRYLLKLCRAMMQYGAPTHRLEECMKMSARVLEIESQFLYIPGCMIISFDDSTTHTTEVKLVRSQQGVDLGKLRDTHACYKDVVHDRVGVEEATQRLEEIIKRPSKYKAWYLVGVYGLASACVGPFAFQARLIDLPVAFLLGCLVGYLQLIAAPSSHLFNNVFEIAAAVLTSFFARAFGSIRGGELFCFAALAQSSIALILPGYTVLCASSELQSKHIVAGSVRMVYAIIYSLFLGFGMTIGIVLWGLFDADATSTTTCSNQMPVNWTFWFVPAFTLCLCVINQAKWKQVPVMVVISFVGYIVNHYSSLRFTGNSQISSTLGALAIGAMANLYSRLGGKVDNFVLDIYETHMRPRIRVAKRQARGQRKSLAVAAINTVKRPEDAVPEPPPPAPTPEPYMPRTRKVGYGLAAAAMLPAIFVQVPSGLAVSGSLVSGVTSANQITHNATGTTTVTSGMDTANVNSAALSVGYSVIQVAIGITVGLFLSALVIYPFGKKRSGLFSF